MNIDVLHELDGFGITHVLKDGFAEVQCPFHADTNPSGSVSLEHGGFKCFACGESAQFHKFLAAILKKEPKLILLELESRYGSSNDKVVDIKIVEACHKALKDETYLRAQLQKRCIDDDICRERRLGAQNGRVTIPVYNKHGNVVNIRKHRPGGEQKSKVINQRGHGKPIRLYPVDQLKYDKIVLCGGELKAVAAAAVLNKVGIGAICATAGEGNWDQRLTPDFKDKTVWIAYDIDEAGRKGAEKIAHQLYNVSREIFIVTLPLDEDAYPNGDVNDYLAEGGDLPVLIVGTDTPWAPAHKRHLFNGDTKEVHVSSVVNAEHTGRRLKTDCVVTAIGQAPYSVPRVIEVTCGKDMDVCAVCPVMHDDPGKEYEIHPEDPALLKMVEASDKMQVEALKQAVDIPARCTSCAFNATSYFHIEDVRISPKLELSSRQIQREMIPAYMMQQDLILNEAYEISGRMHPHPQTQASTLLVSEADVSEDALTLYKNPNPHELNIFKPKEWSVDSIQDKLDELYEDLEANVTGIYGRRNMHLTIDLAYHSVLFIDAFQKPNQRTRKKGWVEVLILGDSAQGKSEATVSLMRHYKLGEKIDCKNATVAGVLGGLQQIGKKWFVVWGVIPNHDKRLVILEELKGMPPDVFSKLTDMRSSGQAQIPKIEKRKTHARTRLVALSNPMDNRVMRSYAFGVEAVRQLIKSPEDVRRFDMALIVSNEEVTPETIHENIVRKMSIDHIYTSELCQKLVLWAWTVDKIKFEDENYVLSQALELQKKYSNNIPLMNAGSGHEKLARLSAALAARTYSTEDYESLIVRKCHVDYIVQFLNTIYSQDNFQYEQYTAATLPDDILEDADDVKKAVNHLPNPLLFHQLLKTSDRFDLQDFSHWTGIDLEVSREMLGTLVRVKAIKRSRRGSYYCVPGFLKILHTMELNREFSERPEFMQEEEF